MARTEAKTFVPVAASGTTTPYSFSIATTSWRASMESSPRPSPKRGASVSLPDAFRTDNLHPQAKGYDIWGAAVKDKLAELMR